MCPTDVVGMPLCIFDEHGGSSQECFKEAWSSHKAVHSQAIQKHVVDGNGVQDPHSGALAQGWMYCIRKGQSRSPQMPAFDWTG